MTVSLLQERSSPKSDRGIRIRVGGGGEGGGDVLPGSLDSGIANKRHTAGIPGPGGQAIPLLYKHQGKDCAFAFMNF